jgi:ribonuclease T2
MACGRNMSAAFPNIASGPRRGSIATSFLQLSEPKNIAPGDLEAAFIKVNPGLSSSAISVTCSGRRLSEVRVCLSKDMQFRACEETDRRACRRDEVVMPPVRGG